MIILILYENIIQNFLKFTIITDGWQHWYYSFVIQPLFKKIGL